ncbi:hypothetical protein HC256_005894 [Beauveria bassiana]|nr:hypothetical protein HC256_005894 [Beauveria bassiana]
MAQTKGFWEPKNRFTHAAHGKVESPLKDILSDLEIICTIRDRMMDQDYCEFIIIERDLRPCFDIPDVVGDALLRLSRTFNAQEPLIKFIRQTMAAAEQDEYLEAFVDGPLSDSNLSTSTYVPRLGQEGH